MHILWLKTELLHPVDKGGKIRTYQMLKELKRDHQITYLTLDDGSAAVDAREKATEYCHEVISIPHYTSAKFSAAFYSELASNLLSPLPYAIKKYDSAPMREQIVQLGASRSFDCIVCDFLAPAVNVREDLPCPTVLFQHNVEAMIWKRHYEVQTNPLKRAYLRGQWHKMRDFERESCRRFDTVVTVSREDREMIRREYEAEDVYDVPTGVDVEFFQPSGAVAPAANNLVFTGSMDWLPNEDAIRYFTEQIMPMIRQKISDVTLTVVGRNPYPSLLELSKRDNSIVVTGRVDDVRPFIEKAAAYVVPLRIGGGTRIGESLAAFNRWHARRIINARTAVMIVSDGYDTGEPERLGEEMRRLRRRCRRIVWLNPLIGWRDYSPRARGMQAALPYIDLFAPAHNLESLAALEPYLARI